MVKYSVHAEGAGGGGRAGGVNACLSAQDHHVVVPAAERSPGPEAAMMTRTRRYSQGEKQHQQRCCAL